MLRSFTEWLSVTGQVVCAVAACSLAACGGNRDPWHPSGGAGGIGGGANNGGSGGVGIDSAENTGASCPLPELAAYSALTQNPKLPDPFQMTSGARIVSKDEWRCRRAEIAAQAQQYELGPKPPPTAKVTAAASPSAIDVSVEDAGNSISFSASIKLPTQGSAPFPAIIAMGGNSLDTAALTDAGVALINFNNNDIADQTNASARGKGKFYTLYGANHGAGAMMAWAWGVSRLIDALASTPDAQIDTAHLGVTGCSRNGKGALIAGAFDERIVLTIPQESGSGGSAVWRVSDAQKAAGQNVQTLSQITGENCWFRSSFSQFGKTASLLPFDHHEVLGLVAPRGLFVIENTSMEWLGNLSCFTSAAVAHGVWEAHGKPENMGLSQVGGHDHCAFPASQKPELLAFVQRFLFDDASADTHVVRSDGNFSVDRDTWVDWETPTLQ